jgi:CheY-like chemotaxis protein
MKSCQCSQCGVSAASLVWGFGLLARDGWGLTPATNPPGAAERGWLCSVCAGRAANVGRGLGRASTPKPQRETATPGSPLKVLIIDDHLLMLRSLARMLADCETVVASSARQAMKVLQNGTKFDAIVSDVMMPLMSGPELYAHCYRQSPELAQRFVFASADPMAARELIDRTASQLGAARAPALLCKPTSRKLLLAAVFEVATPHVSGTYELGLPSGRAEFEAGGVIGPGGVSLSKGSRGTG